jgi:hypothetical protein
MLLHRKRILQLAKANWATHLIATRLGVPETGVWAVLVDSEYDYDPKTGAVWRTVDERQIERRLRQGESINKISRAMHIGNDTVSYVRNRVLERGVSLPNLLRRRRTSTTSTTKSRRISTT